MAVALIQNLDAVSLANAATVALTVSATGAGNLLVAFAQFNDASGTATGVSDGTNSFTQVPALSATAARTITIWYLLSSTAGKTTITATRSGVADTDQKILQFFEVSGWTTCAYDTGTELNSQTSSGNTITGSPITTTGAVGFIAAVEINNDGFVTATTGGSGFTFGTATDFGNGNASRITSASGTYTPAWTSSVAAEAFGSMTAAWKEASAGGGGGDGFLLVAN